LTPGMYDDFDPAIVFEGDWEHVEGAAGAYHGTSSSSQDGTVSIDFEGKAIRWVHQRRAAAEVTIDRVPVDSGQTRFCCFGPGKHYLQIRARGPVDVDAVRVER
jgi:hypothetical protein